MYIYTSPLPGVESLKSIPFCGQMLIAFTALYPADVSTLSPQISVEMEAHGHFVVSAGSAIPPSIFLSEQEQLSGSELLQEQNYLQYHPKLPPPS